MCVNNPTVTTCPTGYYSTNDHCCPEYFYYNLKEDKCVALLDDHCKKSETIFTCSIECDTNYEVLNLPYKI